tara:strand:- start:161 stop:379 length:219 start_codon:yes stop_codon:yes gene_type:complete
MEGRFAVSVLPMPQSAELEQLLTQLDADRAWLLEQIDRGRWPELRLDLAALERELGQMLSRASEQQDEPGRK